MCVFVCVGECVFVGVAGLRGVRGTVRGGGAGLAIKSLAVERAQSQQAALDSVSEGVPKKLVCL